MAFPASIDTNTIPAIGVLVPKSCLDGLATSIANTQNGLGIDFVNIPNYTSAWTPTMSNTTLVASATGSVPLTIKGYSSGQTANLVNVYDYGTNALMLSLTKAGLLTAASGLTVTAGPTSLTGLAAGSSTALSVIAGNASNVVGKFKMAATPSVDAVQVLSSADAVLTCINSAGTLCTTAANGVRHDGTAGTLAEGSWSEYIASTNMVWGRYESSAWVPKISVTPLGVITAGTGTAGLILDSSGFVGISGSTAFRTYYATTPRAMTVARITGTTNNYSPMVRIDGTCTGTMADNFGTGLEFGLNNVAVADMYVQRITANNTANLYIRTATTGTLATALFLGADQQVAVKAATGIRFDATVGTLAAGSMRLIVSGGDIVQQTYDGANWA